MSDLEAFAVLVSLDHGLVAVSTSPAHRMIQSSVVDAGALEHPGTRRPVVAFRAAVAGGAQDNWHEYDCVMAAEHCVAVLVTPERAYANG